MKLLNKNEKGLKFLISKNKKGVELSMNVVIIAIILLVVLVVVIAMFYNLFRKETKQIEEKISGLDDYDGDGTINMFDKCPCKTSPQGTREYNGCSSQAELDDAITSPDKSCLEKKK